uniref:Uncharacterized protein n=1 Tax=Anguilla anguilla TaxID=7936 RepID=A0A0E9U8M4_ANGAN
MPFIDQLHIQPMNDCSLRSMAVFCFATIFGTPKEILKVKPFGGPSLSIDFH